MSWVVRRASPDHSGTTRTVAPGSYAVQESTVQGYATSYSEGCSGSVDRGEDAACAIVNNDIAPEGPGEPGPPEPPGPNPPPPEPGQPRPPLGGLPATLTVITVVRGSKAPSEFVDLIAGTPVAGSPFFRGRSRPGVTRRVRPGSYGVLGARLPSYVVQKAPHRPGQIRSPRALGPDLPTDSEANGRRFRNDRLQPAERCAGLCGAREGLRDVEASRREEHEHRSEGEPVHRPTSHAHWSSGNDRRPDSRPP